MNNSTDQMWFYFSSGCVGVIVNVVVIVTVANWNVIPSKAVRVLLIHQCVTDCLSSLLASITWLTSANATIPENLLGDLICTLWAQEYLLWSVAQASTNNVVLLTIERYFSILHPYLHRRLNKRHLTVSLVMCWILGCVASLGIAFERQRDGDFCAKVSIEPLYFAIHGIVNSMFFFIAPTILVVILNLHMIVFLRKQSRQLRAGRQRHTQYVVVSRELTITVLISGTCFVIFLAPSGVLYFLFTTGLWTYDFEGILSYFVDYLVTLNFVINPLVYIVRMRAFRRGLVRWKHGAYCSSPRCRCCYSNRVDNSEEISISQFEERQ